MSGLARALARRGVLAWLLAVFVAALLGGAADARPGGGQSFSSGGSHSYSGGSHSYSGGGSYHSSGGGGGGGDFNAGVALVIILGLFIMFSVIAALSNAAHTPTYTSSYSPPEPPPKLDLAPVLERDPDFSRVAFEDFVYRLYSAAQRARHDRAELAKLVPYLGPEAFDKLASSRSRVDQVVIGTLRIIDARVDASVGFENLVVAFEANLAGPTGTLNVAERWVFIRSVTATTRPPERTRALACPNCGAPFVSADDPRTCSHCGEAISVGRFDWTVSQIYVDAASSVGYTLTGTTPEIGNDYPTVTDGNAQLAFMNLRTDDPGVTWDAFTSRVGMIYQRLGEAWNAQDLRPVRGLVTSSLLQYLEFWIREYKRQELANRLDNARIAHIALAKCTRDKWYDAVTVRVYAAGLDYTLDHAGRVVGGSRTTERAYTEYWTFLRSSARRGPITQTPNCPNCGAPLAISDAGACTSCNAEIESASFDWTLSKIEQDDVYRG